MARDLVQVEERGEEIVAIVRAERGAFIPAQPARCARAELHKGMQQFRTGALHATVVEHAVHLAKHTAVNRMPNAVAPARLREVDEGAGEDRFALGREGDPNRVVHAA